MISLFRAFFQKRANEPDPVSDPALSFDDSRFDVVLEDCGRNEIGVIKVARAATGASLAEAKATVEGAPKTVKTGLSKDDADKLKTKLENAGAKVRVIPSAR